MVFADPVMYIIIQQVHAMPIYGLGILVIRYPNLTDILRYT